MGDKASVIYHGEGNAQYRAMLIRAPSLKQWLWEAALPQIVSAEIHAYKSGCTGTSWEGLCSSDWIPNKTQAWRLWKCVLISFRWHQPQQTISCLFCCVPFSGFGGHWLNQRPVNAHWWNPSWTPSSLKFTKRLILSRRNTHLNVFWWILCWQVHRNTEGSLLIFSLVACRRDGGCKVTIPS